MKNYEKILKMMFINIYCTDFMFQEFLRYLTSLLNFMSTGFN